MNNDPYPSTLRYATFPHVVSETKQARGENSESSIFIRLNSDEALTIFQELLRRHPELRSETEDLARHWFEEARLFEDSASKLQRI